MGVEYAHRYLRVDGELQAKRKQVRSRGRFLRRRGEGGNDRQLKNSGVVDQAHGQTEMIRHFPLAVSLG